ncbi:MAG TPA: hypothetical protein VH144_02120, partial [Candidatus Saccharimonadales bacterium]|nr:hypothetical protein [Candidatus Saccharimonadales bacterium]
MDKFKAPNFGDINGRRHTETPPPEEADISYLEELRRNSQPMPPATPEPATSEADRIASVVGKLLDERGIGNSTGNQHNNSPQPYVIVVPTPAAPPQPPFGYPSEQPRVPYTPMPDHYDRQPPALPARESLRSLEPARPATELDQVLSNLTTGRVIESQAGRRIKEIKTEQAERPKKRRRLLVGMVAVAAVGITTAAVMNWPKISAITAAATGDISVSANCEVGYELPIGYNLDAHSVKAGKAVEDPKIQARLSANLAGCLTADHPLKVTVESGNKLSIDLASTHYKVGTVGPSSKLTVTPATAPDQAAAYPYAANLLPKPEKDPAVAFTDAMQIIAAGLLSSKVEATDTGDKIADPVLYDLY